MDRRHPSADCTFRVAYHASMTNSSSASFFARHTRKAKKRQVSKHHAHFPGLQSRLWPFSPPLKDQNQLRTRKILAVDRMTDHGNKRSIPYRFSPRLSSLAYLKPLKLEYKTIWIARGIQRACLGIIDHATAAVRSKESLTGFERCSRCETIDLVASA